MIIDSSALVAVLRRESDARAYEKSMAAYSGARVSAANYLETAIVTDTSSEAVDRTRLDTLLRLNEVTVAAVTESQVRIARQAYREFGKGSGHPAQLNFGDCFAYALAAETDEPLLYKGEGFGHTDVRPAL